MKTIISSSKLISLIFSILVLCFAIVSLSYAAWTAPTSPPPSINAPLPLTESGTAQGKIGMLILNCGNGADCINSTTFASSGLLIPYGNVGIGTMSPGSKLEIKNGNISVIRSDGTAAQSSVKNTNTSSGTQDAKSGVITLESGGDPYTFWAIKNNADTNYTTTWNAGIDNSDSDKFEVSYGGTPGTSPYLTITTAGNVGIGTTNPSALLHINKSSGAGQLIIGSSDGSVNGGELQFRSSYSDLMQTNKIAGLIIGEPDNATGGRLIFKTAGVDSTSLTERMRIDGNGYVFIGDPGTYPLTYPLEIETIQGQNLQVRPSVEPTGGVMLHAVNGNNSADMPMELRGSSITFVGGPRIYTTSTKPTCNSASRGTLWFTQGASGVGDKLEICAKNSSNNYYWATMHNF